MVLVLGPNPCEGILNIQINSALEGTLRIFNVQRLFIGQWHVSKTTRSVDLSLIQLGICLIHKELGHISRNHQIVLKK